MYPNYGNCGDPSNPSTDPITITAYCNDSNAEPMNCNGCERGHPVMQWNFMDYVDDVSFLFFFLLVNKYKTGHSSHVQVCMSAFTEQQGWRVLYYTVTKRPSFASSNWEVIGGGSACVAGQYNDGSGCQPCPQSTSLSLSILYSLSHKSIHPPTLALTLTR